MSDILSVSSSLPNPEKKTKILQSIKERKRRSRTAKTAQSLKGQKAKPQTGETSFVAKSGLFSDECLKRWSRLLLLSCAVNNLSALQSVASDDQLPTSPSLKLASASLN